VANAIFAAMRARHPIVLLLRAGVLAAASLSMTMGYAFAHGASAGHRMLAAASVATAHEGHRHAGSTASKSVASESAELASAELASAEPASTELAPAELASTELASTELASTEHASAELASAEHASAKPACHDQAGTDDRAPASTPYPDDQPPQHAPGGGCCTMACHAALAVPAIDTPSVASVPVGRLIDLSETLEGRSSARTERPPKRG
jgi:selectin P ligand